MELKDRIYRRKSVRKYTGAPVDEKTVAYDSDDWMDCLKFFHWVL